MMIIAYVVFLALAAISALHLLWATGSSFPSKNRKILARTVIGFKGRDRMPPKWQFVVIAALLLLDAVWALVLGRVILPAMPSWLAIAGGVILVLVFAARGIAGYTKRWRKIVPKQPFARYDRLYYSPLCIVLSLGFLALTYGYAA